MPQKYKAMFRRQQGVAPGVTPRQDYGEIIFNDLEVLGKGM